MAELSDVKAYSNSKDQEQLSPIGAYKIQKVLINGDFLAKDKLDDSFLLSSTNRLSDFHQFDFQGTNIIEPIEIIEDHNQMYEVFPLDKKLMWAGEIIDKNKSEIYCVTLLYSVIRHILKPLKTMRLFNCQKYLSMDNIWVKDNTLFLFLRSKGSGKNLLKTENTRPNKRFYRIEETQSWNEVAIIKKIGDVFCEMFFGKDGERETPKLQTFKEIIRSMCKGEMTLQQLENLMNDKKAIKKFMSNRKANSRRILYDTLDVNKGKVTIDFAYERLENIPINMGRPMNGMLFSNNKRYHAQLREERIGKTLVFSSLDSDVPPSFSNSKRFKKKMSLFANTKAVSRRHSQSNRYENDSQNGPQTKRLSIANEDTHKNFSFAKDYTPNKILNPQQTYFKSNKQRNIKIREMFNGLNKEELLTSKLDKFHEKSKEKALKKIKESLSMDQQSHSMEINDEKFRSALKERKSQYVKQVNSYFQKAQEHYENLKSKVKVTTNNMEKFNQWEQGVEKGLSEIRIEVSRPREKEVHNEMLTEEKTSRAAEIPVLEQHLFESRYESSEGSRSGVMDNLGLKQDKNKGKKNRFDEELFTSANQRDFDRANLSVHQSNRVKTNSNALNVQRQSKEMQKKQVIMKQETIKEKEVVYKKSQSEVELISMNNIIQKLQPSLPPVVKQQIRIKEEPVPTIQTKPQAPPKVVAPIIAVSKPNGFFEQVQQNMFNQIPSPQQYTYVSKIPEPKKEVEMYEQEKISPRPSVAKKEKTKIKNSASKFGDFSDQIEQVNLGVKQEKKPPKQAIKEQKKPVTPRERPNTKTQIRQESVNGRSKTNQSNASSNGIKSVRKQIDQYIFLVNKMGEAVAKTAKLSKKLEKIQWYVGVYFLYKRFYYQRKTIERYLQDNIPKLTRYEEFSEQEWHEWLQKGERQALLAKCKQDNVNIENSLKRMVKKVEVKQLPSRVLINANVNKNNAESTKIAVQYVVDEYDLAVEMNLLSDPEIATHLCEMINALYVIAQLDGKIHEKKKISQFTRVNRSPEQLSQMVQTIYDLYEEGHE